MFFPVSALSFPNDFNEGYAMFFSGEKWGYGREDANLRKGVFSNDLSYKHPDGFFYTTGFSMVRFLYEFYGMEKLQELLKYRNKAKLYSFKTAFKKVYKKSLGEFKEEWRKYVYTYYFGSAYEMKSLNHDTSAFNSLNSVNKIVIKGWNNLKNSVVKDSLIFFMGKGCKKQSYYELAFGYFDENNLVNDTLQIRKIKKIESVSSARDFAISGNLKYLSYVKYERGQYGSIMPKIFRYNIESGKKQKITTGQHIQIDNQGGIYFQDMQHENNYIKYVKDNIEKIVLTFDSKTAIGEILLSPDEKSCAITKFDENNEFLLEIYSVTDFTLKNSEVLQTFPRKIVWYGNNDLFVTLPTEIDSRTTLQQYNCNSKQWSTFQTPPYNVITYRIEKTDSTFKALTYGEMDRKGSTLLKIDLQVADSTQYQPNVNYYSRWIHTQYPNEIVVPDTMPEITKEKYSHFKNIEPYVSLIYPDYESLFLMTYLMDPLMKHDIALAAFLEYDGMKPYFFGSYTNRSFWATINLSYAKYNWLGGIWKETWFTQKIENIGLNFSFPIDIFKNPFLRIDFITGLMYQDISINNENFSIKPIFEDGIAYTSETGLTIQYNLPYKNDFIHPVRKYKIGSHLSMANSDLGMKKDFTEQEIDIEFSFAPLYDVFNQKIDKFLFTNKTNFNSINGKYFSQYQPGFDINENIPVGGGLITERHYLRGIDKTLVGEKMLIMKNEFWMKISDDINLSINLGNPMLDLQYIGIGIWTDYGKIYVKDVITDFQTAGYEIKGLLNILGIPTIQRFGRAYNLDNKKLNYYYQMNIPLDLGL